MDKLTVREFAELKGCSERHARRLLIAGQIAYEVADDPLNKIKQYLIPASALPESLQAKYYAGKGGLAVQGIKEVAARPKLLEEYSEDEREQIRMWSELLLDWQRYRNDPAYACKTSVDKAYVAMMSLKRPELRLSEPTLRRKWAAYKAGDLDGLIDKRGQWRKGKTDKPEILWDAFLWFYLDERKYPITKCCEYVTMWAREFHPELAEEAENCYYAFYRRVQQIEAPVRVLMRDGAKAYNDRCAPYIERLYDNLESNQYWVTDTHTFDVLTRSATNETTHRLHLTAFLDARSQMLTGWYIAEQPGSQVTLMALRHGILRCGAPVCVLSDNGREILNIDIGGLKNRQKKSTQDLPVAPPIFQRLGIELHTAIVQNAQAKPIERTFGTLKNSLSRLFKTYTGGNVVEKPENLKDTVRKGNIPLDDDLRRAVDAILDGYYNMGEYTGPVIADRGKRRIDVFNENLHSKRVASSEDLTLLLMRSTRPQKIGQRGVHVEISGVRLWFWDTQLLWHQEKQVYVRYDPADMREVRVYDLDDRFMQTAPMDRDCLLEWGDSREKLQAAQSKKKKVVKAVKTVAENYCRLDPAERIDALDLVIRHSNLQKEGMHIGTCDVLEPIRPNEKSYLTAASNGSGAVIDMEKMLRNAARNSK